MARDILLGVFFAACVLISPSASDDNDGLSVILEQNLATPTPTVTATMVCLTFPPGSSGTAPHTHPGPVVGYVLEGEFLMQVRRAYICCKF